jgi:hypothetical protein
MQKKIENRDIVKAALLLERHKLIEIPDDLSQGRQLSLWPEVS